MRLVPFCTLSPCLEGRRVHEARAWPLRRRHAPRSIDSRASEGGQGFRLRLMPVKVVTFRPKDQGRKGSYAASLSWVRE